MSTNPHTPTSKELTAAILDWLHNSHFEDATESDTSCTLCLDSLDHTEIVMHIEETIGRDIPDSWLEILNEKSTIKQWAEEVAKKLNE